jgi:hypothetical protein
VNVGNISHGIALGDIDGDGDLDLLAAKGNSTDYTISVRVNDGTGLFSGSQNVSVGPSPYSVAIGDVDGDGDLDLVAANSQGNSVSVRLNNGSGTFGGGSDVSVGSAPFSVAVGDVDADGDLDLLTANNNSSGGPGTASVRLNNGNGTYSGGQDVSVGLSPYCLALGDVDGDGDVDFFTANYNNSFSTVSVRLNNGSGTFGGGSDVSVGYRCYTLAVGDVDDDGDLDLLSPSMSLTGFVIVNLNNGSGLFSVIPGVGVDTQPYGIALGDMDGDGDLDLLTANRSNVANSVSVRLNGSSGPLATTSGYSLSALALFPNPAAGAATLIGAAPHAAVLVFDVMGRTVAAATTDAAGTAGLALDGLPAGVYVVRCGGQALRLAVE